MLMASPPTMSSWRSSPVVPQPGGRGSQSLGERGGTRVGKGGGADGGDSLSVQRGGWKPDLQPLGQRPVNLSQGAPLWHLPQVNLQPGPNLVLGHTAKREVR